MATAIYLSDWHNIIKSKSTSKSMIIVIKRAQNPVKFNAGGLFAMNVECLKNVRMVRGVYINVKIVIVFQIVNTGISFYTLMKNRKHENEN